MRFNKNASPDEIIDKILSLFPRLIRNRIQFGRNVGGTMRSVTDLSDRPPKASDLKQFVKQGCLYVVPSELKVRLDQTNNKIFSFL